MRFSISDAVFHAWYDTLEEKYIFKLNKRKLKLY